MTGQAKEQKIYRTEYPRPDFKRDNWESLNGIWGFEYDDENIGEEERWFCGHTFANNILVPFCYQSKLSGIHDTEYHPYVWYRKDFTTNTDIQDESLLLKFGAVDYYAKVWVNGHFIGEHAGGYTPFEFDIAPYIIHGTNTIVLRAEDKNNCFYPRGKQHWNVTLDRCWYTATTGIWQSVWLERTGKTRLDAVHIVPDIDNRCVKIKADIINETGCNVACKLLHDNKTIACCQRKTDSTNIEFIFSIDEHDYIEEYHYWSPERPNLYDVELTISDNDRRLDKITTYFGMRKISVENGQIHLNNKPLYQKLVLDQGYWPDGLLTAPSDESLKEDLKLIKAMGFNGVRMHQKIEDPRFYYWADKMGVLVWEEMPSAYVFSQRGITSITKEWLEVLKRDVNHPSVVTWVTLNESWGVRNIVSSKQQQDFAAMLYYLTKSVDTTRLVCSNDGWEQINDSDICGIHDYETTSEDICGKYGDMERLLSKDAQGRLLYAYGNKRDKQPVILSEFGGIATESHSGWGYNDEKITADELLVYYQNLIRSAQEIESLSGYCYTQLYDVMQEVNGLLDENRKPKIAIKEICRCNNKLK